MAHEDLIECPVCKSDLSDTDEPNHVECLQCGWSGTVRNAWLGQVGEEYEVKAVGNVFHHLVDGICWFQSVGV